MLLSCIFLHTALEVSFIFIDRFIPIQFSVPFHLYKRFIGLGPLGRIISFHLLRVAAVLT
nr:MAG TPA: hypothetical protein [Caudoviricetes sp.]